MADNIVGKKIKELVETTSVNSTDDFLLEDTTPKTKRIKWSSLLTAITNAIAKDSGWQKCTLTSSFVASDGDTANTPEYRKIGKKVFIRGRISPKAALAGSVTSVPIFTLPAEYCPSKSETFVCQGTSKNTWYLQIFASGSVSFSRYGTTEYISCPTSAQLIFSASYSVV